MRKTCVSLALIVFCLLPFLQPAVAQRAEPTLEIEGKTEGYYTETNRTLAITNGVTIRYTDLTNYVVLTADKATIDQSTGDIIVSAEGSVSLRSGDATWNGDRLTYNYSTQEINGEHFRMGKAPFFTQGGGLYGYGQGSNGVYFTTNAYVTTDDYQEPLQKVKARHFTIVPGKYIEAHDATLCVADVPVFYLPFYHHSLVHEPNGFTFIPGYRNLFGPYLLTTYRWVLNDQLNGGVHLDYREKRGFAGGPDVNYNLGPWGDGTFRYYFAHDLKPGNDPDTGVPLTRDRQRIYFSYSANPATNLTIMSQVAKQTDAYVVRDFFESQYNKDTQPKTFFDVNQFWQNWSLDALVQPRVNPFWETVERLPDVRLNGFRQEIGNTPLYYESQSSIGYFRRSFSDTNVYSLTNAFPYNPRFFSATRADTFHQITLPENFFGWLNFTPRVGERFTYYSAASGPGAYTTNEYRNVFNTGAELSFTASRLWAGERSDFWELDGVRHIFQPSLNYVYIPQPSVLPYQLPQFDYQTTNNLRLLPIDFPDYNSIDSINSQNTIRYGLNNRLQTKRNGEVEDFLTSSIYMDWNLRPRSDQTTFSDIYSDLSLRPRSWLTFNSSTRYSIANGQFNLSQHTLTFQPNSAWSWTVGHLYLRSGSLFGTGDNLYTSLFFYRFNENWGARLAHYFDASSGTLQEQDYSIYRDFRSWTAALTFRELNNQGGNGKDYSVAFTFSFKSFPRFGLGQDTVRAANLIGY